VEVWIDSERPERKLVAIIYDVVVCTLYKKLPARHAQIKGGGINQRLSYKQIMGWREQHPQLNINLQLSAS